MQIKKIFGFINIALVIVIVAIFVFAFIYNPTKIIPSLAARDSAASAVLGGRAADSAADAATDADAAGGAGQAMPAQMRGEAKYRQTEPAKTTITASTAQVKQTKHAVATKQAATDKQAVTVKPVGSTTAAATQAATAQTSKQEQSGSTSAASTSASAAQKTVQNATNTSSATSAKQSDISSVETEVVDKPKLKLDGVTICIDPGHQKKQNGDLEPIAPKSSIKKPKVSSGTAGFATGDMEYALNLAVGLKLKDLLEAEGASVVMTRTENDVNVSNVERAKIGNEAKADLAIRIHADSSDNRDLKGVLMLIPSSKHVGEDLAETSKNAGKVVLDKVIEATGAKSRGLSVRDDMTGFNWSKVPVILIEMGFMSNAQEDRLLATDDYRNKIAKGLFNGCVAYFEK